MSSELSATIALILYALLVIGLVIRSVLSCRYGPGAWLLYNIERVHSGIVFKWRTDGPCPLPSDGGALVVGNHRSPIDPMVIWMNNHIRPNRSEREWRIVSFLTASEYFEIPLLGWLIRTMRAIPVDRDGQDMGPTREAIRRLRAGRLVGIFPEAGINTGEGLREPNPGVALLALKGKVPVYPCYIHEASQQDNMIKPFYTRHRVRLTWGEPIDLSEYYGQRATVELLVEVTNLIMEKVAELGGVDFQPAIVPAAEEPEQKLSA